VPVIRQVSGKLIFQQDSAPASGMLGLSLGLEAKIFGLGLGLALCGFVNITAQHTGHTIFKN